MNKLWKRLLSGALCLLMLAALLPTGTITAFASETGGGRNYQFSSW